MQSDAFPTPSIYTRNFHINPVKHDLEQFHDEYVEHLQHLLAKIEGLIEDATAEESQNFWENTDRLKIKHQVIASMQKVESLFLSMATAAIDNTEVIADIHQSLRYVNASTASSSQKVDIPQFPKFPKE